MSQVGQSHAWPFFILWTVRGVVEVVWVEPAESSERSSDDAAAVVSMLRCLMTTLRVTILTVSAKWKRSVSSWTNSERFRCISVDVSFHVLISVRVVVTNF